MDLHKPGSIPDWEQGNPNERNRWQRMAARTQGIATPGNAISLIGVILVFAGLIVIVRHHTIAGLIIMGLGRAADILDGFVANATKTKSMRGESIDASCDKIAAAGVLVVLIFKDFLPAIPGVLIFAQNIANVILTAVAKAQHSNMHPNRSGKIAAAAEWVVIPLFILSTAYHHDYSVAAYTCLVAFIAFGYTATAKYIRYILRFKKTSITPSARIEQ